MNSFQKKVNEVVIKIPQGSVSTYAAVAGLAGRPKSARAVGNILKRNCSTNIPCHRVVKSDGAPGGYNSLRGSDKLSLLKKEGVFIVKGFIDLEKYRWKKK